MKRTLNALQTLAILAVALLTPLAQAGPGHDGDHDHGPAASEPTRGGPQRLPDGAVFLPKPAQRQLGMRTERLAAGQAARAIELAGKVAMDPNHSGKVQATQPGRIVPGPKGLPNPGDTVRAGQVLAFVEPTLGPLERSSQAAQLADLKAQHTLAEKRLARLQALSDTVPRKEIEAAQSELLGLAARIAALSQVAHREPLTAPVSGVIAMSRAVAGQVVDAREMVFEIIHPAHFQIEAQSFDTALPGQIEAAFLLAGSQRVPLKFLGAARSLREQALPIYFSLGAATPASLAVGEPVRVVVQTREKIQGIALPRAALMKNAANQTIVWVKTAPELFAPRLITFVPLDGARVSVVSGLDGGDRVVTEGASLINQVR